MKRIIALILCVVLLGIGSAMAEADLTTSEPININDQYSEYARNPERHKGEYIEFSGEVIQVIEGTPAEYRVRISGDNVVYVVYSRHSGEPRTLEGDMVTVRGIFAETVTYQSTLGGQITIPACSATEIVAYVPLSVSATGTNASEDMVAFDVVGYPYSKKESKNYLYLLITNNSGKTARIDILIRYYDENGGLVGISNLAEEAFADGTQIITCGSNDVPFATYEYEITAEEESYYTSVDQNLVVEKTVLPSKVIFSVTNEGDIAAEFADYNVLFLRDGSIVDTGWSYVTDNDSEIKPGKTEYREESSSEDFDEVIVAVHGKGDK